MNQTRNWNTGKVSELLFVKNGLAQYKNFPNYVYFMMRWLWDHSFSKFAKFSEKLTFLTPVRKMLRTLLISIAKGGRMLQDLEKNVQNCFVRTSYYKILMLYTVNYFKSNLKFWLIETPDNTSLTPSWHKINHLYGMNKDSVEKI